MKPEAVAIRLDELKHGPLKGSRPVVAIAKQGMMGVAAQEHGVPGLSKAGLEAHSLPAVGRGALELEPSMPHLIDNTYFLIDCSSSMRGGMVNHPDRSRLAHVQSLISSLPPTFTPPETQVGLITFSRTARPAITFDGTFQMDSLASAVGELKIERGTRFDAAFEVLRNDIAKRAQELGRLPRSLAIFLTDGQNMGSPDIAARLALAIRDLNAGTFLVGIGSRYDQGMILKHAGEFGFSGWGHTPMSKGTNVFHDLVPDFMSSMRSSDFYLKIRSHGSIAASFGVTPAIKHLLEDVFFIGYQQSGVGVYFEQHEDISLKLEVLDNVAQRDANAIDIPIIDFADAGAHFENQQ
ncbi:MAG: VWA domain-containing protein, partial [Deltaproteobacteria bacterium]|nr:VWA domain-containing protein [Deltaproteobacteria bacterium]